MRIIIATEVLQTILWCMYYLYFDVLVSPKYISSSERGAVHGDGTYVIENGSLRMELNTTKPQRIHMRGTQLSSVLGVKSIYFIR